MEGIVKEGREERKKKRTQLDRYVLLMLYPYQGVLGTCFRHHAGSLYSLASDHFACPCVIRAWIEIEPVRSLNVCRPDQESRERKKH
jgi:hypothetical protein